MALGNIILYVQFFFAIVIGVYFWTQLKTQQGSKFAVEKESRKECERLRQMRAIRLSEPLSEITRPSKFEEIIGQEDGLKALRAALCGPNPQHVIVYGPPGVGKTAAARLVLEEAKAEVTSPFKSFSRFVEIDATTARFDERGIADPLIGSVHDPIYQGAGPMGVAGIPQPKAGAVTRAHGGILFIDEIGELHHVQMNKLLKVLEDRKVFLESAYYNSEDPAVPGHIRDMFENGLPADFRLVGATTRLPEEIPPAIRSRCMEVFFRPLLPDEVGLIALNACRKIKYEIDPDALEVLKKYARNGREAVNFVQLGAGLAMWDGREHITVLDIEWVVSSEQRSPRPERKIHDRPQVGLVNGLAVSGPNTAMLMEIEVKTIPTQRRNGKVTVTGIIEEEELGGHSRRMRRKSMAMASVENVLTVLRAKLALDPKDHDIHINFPGGVPVDGPSAGSAMLVAIYSALTEMPADNEVAITGELSVRGYVKPVGGIVAKVAAARQAGAAKVLIPKENWQQIFGEQRDLKVVPIDTVEELLEEAVPNFPRQGAFALAKPDRAAAL